MNFSSILSIVMLLLSKREELTKVVTEAIALFNQIKALFPGLENMLLPPGGVATQTGYSVQWLQESLNTLQDAGLTVDGDYGSATKEAVKKFQASHGLTVDGWCGVLTQAAIIRELG